MTKLLFIKLIKIFMTFATLIMAGYLIYALVILMWTPPKNLKKYDAIIVLTGSKGRIESAFKLLLDNKAPRLLISGVQNRIAFQDLIQANSTSLTQDQIDTLRNHCCIDLDYVADTTETNATETNKWIKNNHIKNFILVTSAQHMPRAYLQFHNHLDDNIAMTAYPYHEKSQLDFIRDIDFWYYIARENLKFYGSLIKFEKQ